MADKTISNDPVTDKLSEVLTVLQDILILQAANTGMSKAQARKIVGVADARISRVWRHIKKNSKKLGIVVVSLLSM